MTTPHRAARPRVLVTRQPEQAGELVQALRAGGAVVLEVPLIEVVPPNDPGALDAALRHLDGYDWVAFTSANAVRAVVDGLARLGVHALPARTRTASVGPATTALLLSAFPEAPPPLTPAADFRAEGLAAAFARVDLTNARVLLPASASARETLAGSLAEQGARVDVVAAYRTVTPATAAGDLAVALRAGVDVVAFASPSAVRGFVSTCPAGVAWPAAAVIGPVTRDAAQAAGFDVRVVAPAGDARGLAEAVLRLTLLG